jgi:deoxyribodipyrimidine photo-lyase
MGPFRLRFLIESVISLREQLTEIYGGLIISIGNPAEILNQICHEYSTDTIYASKEITDEETALEKELQQTKDLRLFWGSTLFHPEDIPFNPEDIPDIFTQFRKKVEKQSHVRKLTDAPETIFLPDSFKEKGMDKIKELLPDQKPDPRAAIRFTGGSKAGLSRIDHYIWKTKSIEKYKFTRNGLIGADYSGKFSPWLANGSISPREIYWQVKRYEESYKSNISTYWMVFELLWRDYFRYIAWKYGNRIFKYEGIRGSDPKLQEDWGNFEKWQTGNTGEPFVDANMQELNLTGFMSNRGRQNVASYLVKDLNADWRMGAAWFESMLVDYDPCSNYGNWMYVAGVGNDPREDRYFNVKKQAERYDPDGEYVKLWLRK